jgi:hypothetical protein
MRFALIICAALILQVFAVRAQNLPIEANNLTASPSPSPASVNEDKKESKKSKKNSESSTAANKFNLPPEKLNPVKIPRFETAPVIDGKLDEELWKQAAAFKDFFQTSPGVNIAPSKPTIAYMGYDAEHLYIGFYCWDEPDKIRATVAKRDEVFGEDNVRVWLDTYNDQRRAYLLGFNPLGIQQDGIYTEGQGYDYSVDVVMESKGAIHTDGWAVEAKIPFKSLRYSIGKGKMWGFNVARNIDRFNDEFDQWMPDDRDVTGILIEAGKITGIEDIKVERTLEIVPSITISESGLRKRTITPSALTPVSVDPGRFVNEPVEAELGVNVKFNITPNITLDAAFNPDFAEIEADAPVVTANQRFPIFFQERRPFFLEGVEIFQAPLQSFYSRTIIDPDVAAKLTGKVDKTSFGFLLASDNAPGNYSEDERNDPVVRRRIDEFLDKNAYFGVLRVKRDVGRENDLGFFATARTFPKNRNFTGGFDGRFKLTPNLVSQFQVLGTHSRKVFYNPEENASQYRTGNGLGYVWNLDYTEQNRGWFLEFVGRSRDYRADAGFTRRTNTNRAFFANRFSTTPKPNAKLIRIDWRQFASLNYDWQGRSQDASVSTELDFSLQGNLSFDVSGGVSFERLFEEEFGAQRTAANPNQGEFFGAGERSAYQPYLSASVNKTFNERFSAYGFVGTIFNAFDFDSGAGARFPRVSRNFPVYQREYDEYLRRYRLNPDDPKNIEPREPKRDPGVGRQFDLNVGFEYKPIDPLRVSLDYTKAKLVRDDTGRTAFDTNIFTLRSTYQFSRFTFARIRWDYDSLESNASGQVLFGYNPNPGTAFYVGYNDNFNYNGFSPFTGQLEPRFERNSRTFFIRASYLFRKSF